jgi:hypothetical protein
MADPNLVSKNLEEVIRETNRHAELIAAEIGSTCWIMRRSFGMPMLRELARRGVLQFEPPLPDAPGPRGTCTK